MPLDETELVLRSNGKITPERATLIRSEVLSGYLDTLSDSESARAQKHADTIYEQGGGMPSFVVLTPVAAHQEQPQTILHALGQYDLQKDSGPFTIILGLNYPASHRSSPLIDANRAAVEEARLLYPDLDIRTIEQSYPGKTTIGRIRRDIWNSALTVADRQNQEEGYREFFGYNQDIDLVTLSPHFIQNTKDRLRFDVARFKSIPDLWAGGFINPVPTRSKHAYDPRFPNVSKAVLWHEFSLRHHPDHFFEAGVVVPFTFYAKNGGISAKARVGEVLSLIAKRGSSTDGSTTNRALIGAYAETNIRRYVERLHDNNFDTIWTPDSFSQTDRYRESTDELQDITPERLERIIVFSWDSVKDALLKRVHEIISWGPYDEDLIPKVRELTNRELLVAQRVLERVIGLPDFAKVVEADRHVHARILSTIYAEELAYTAFCADEEPPDPSIREPR